MKKLLETLKDYFKKLFKGRNFKHGSNAVLLILLVLGIIWFVQKIINSYPLQYDTTTSKQYTLSEQSKKIVGDLKQDLMVTVFVKRNVLYEKYMLSLLKDLAKVSSRVKTKIYDLDVDTTAAKGYKIMEYNTMVIELGDKRKDIYERDILGQDPRRQQQGGVEFKGEQAIINAILEVQQAKKKIVYCTDGHKEKDFDDMQSPSGAAVLKQMLIGDNYDVKKLNIIKEGKIPEDCTVLVVAGPKQAFTAAETDAIKKYLENGGKAILLFEPLTNSGFDSLLANWELKLDNDFVVDTKSCLNLIMYSDPASPIPDYERHQITEPLQKSNVPVFFPSVRSISETAEKSKDRVITKEKLFMSSATSWGETDLTSLKSGKVKKDSATDLAAPLCLGYTVKEFVKAKETKKEDKKEGKTEEKKDATLETKIVIIGDSDFISNAPGGVGGFQGGVELFANSINWLMDEGLKIAIRPKMVDFRPLVLTPGQDTIIWVMTIIVTPLLVVGTGIFVWWRRRGK